MATTTNIVTSYAGTAAAGYIASCLLAQVSISNITVHENVKGKMVLRTLDVTDILQDAACDFTPTGTVSLGEVVLDTKGIMVNIDQCKQDYLNAWEVLEMRANNGLINDDNLPASFEDFLIQQIIALLGQSIEINIWNGLAANAGEFEGLIARLTTAKTTPDVTGAPITSSNVITEMAKMADAMSDCVYQKGDAAFYVPTATARAYQRALGYGAISSPGDVNTWNNQLVQGTKPMDFEGIQILISPGMNAVDMVLCSRSDLHFGTNIMADDNAVKVLDMGDLDGSKNVRFIMNFEADSQVTNPDDIVWGQFTT